MYTCTLHGFGIKVKVPNYGEVESEYMSLNPWYMNVSVVSVNSFYIFKYDIESNISNDDCYKDISHLIGKVKTKVQQDFQS